MSEESQTETINAQYSFSVSYRFLERIKKIVFLRKALQLSEHSIQSWLIKAINNRLKQDMEGENLLRQTQIMVRIPDELEQKINDSVEIYKKTSCHSFSKKKWLLAAIEEQLEEDEKHLPRKFQENNSLKNKS